MSTGRDYIVEYSTADAQKGSLVLRFDSAPSAREIRAALIRQGVPGGALREVNARPVGGPAPPPTSAPEGRQARTPVVGVVLAVLVLVAVVTVVVNTREAAQLGKEATYEMWAGDAVAKCRESLDRRRAHPLAQEGLWNRIFPDSPTAFLLTPANAAYFGSCVLALQR